MSLQLNATNIGNCFTVTNTGSYKFNPSSTTWAANNLGVNNSDAITRWTAKRDCYVSIGYSIVTETNYDKFYIYDNGTVVSTVNGISGTKSATISVYLHKGEYVEFKYHKDSSNSSSGEKCTFTCYMYPYYGTSISSSNLSTYFTVSQGATYYWTQTTSTTWRPNNAGKNSTTASMTWTCKATSLDLAFTGYTACEGADKFRIRKNGTLQTFGTSTSGVGGNTNGAVWQGSLVKGDTITFEWYKDSSIHTSPDYVELRDVRIDNAVMGYTVTYSTPYGTKPSSRTGVSTVTSAMLPTLTSTGRTHNGWYTSTAYTTKIVAGRVLTANETWYAKWTANTYTISYTLNGGTNPSGYPTSYTYGVGTTLPTPTRGGYTFKGWYTNSSFTGSAVTTISTTQTGTYHVYAKWEGNNYTVTLNVQGGDGGATSVSVQYGSSLPSINSLPTKSGYNFGGYFTGTDGSGTKYWDYDGSPAVNTYSQVGNLTVYAYWKDLLPVYQVEGGKAVKKDAYKVIGGQSVQVSHK